MKLDLERKERFFGQTIKEYLENTPNELEIDAVGMWQLVLTGRDSFGLQGDDLLEFVRLCILALLDRGARPVTGGGNTSYDWLIQAQFGETKEEITNAVLKRWQDPEFNEDELWEIWFALPSPYVGPT